MSWKVQEDMFWGTFVCVPCVRRLYIPTIAFEREFVSWQKCHGLFLIKIVDLSLKMARIGPAVPEL